MFIRKVAATTTVSAVTQKYIEDGHPHNLQDKNIPDYVSIFRVHGPFLFGATEKLTAITDKLSSLPPFIILRLRNMTAIDATGLMALEELAEQVHHSGRTLILCSARTQPAKLMAQADFAKQIGEENICPHIEAALVRVNLLRDAT